MTRRSITLILIALFTAEIISAFETAMIYAAIGDLIKELGSPVAAGWLVTIYLLVSAAATAIVARLGDMYGRRRVLLWVLGVVAVASIVSACTTYFPLILFGRGVQGVAGAIMPLCFGLARENLPENKVSFGVGVIVSGASAGTMIGLILGGWITDHYGWHAVFLASAALAAFAWTTVRFILPVSPVSSARPRIDYVSAALFVPGLVAVLFAISSGKSWGWTHPGLLAITAGGIALLVIWVLRSLRITDPLIDVRLLAHRPVMIANLSYGLLALGALQVTLVFEILLQAPTWTGIGMGMSAAAAGVLKMPANIAAIFAGLASGPMVARFGGRVAMLAAGAATTLGWALAIATHDSVLGLVMIISLISAGTTFFYAAVPNVLMASVSNERTSEVTGMLAVVRAICMGVGAQLLAVLLSSSTVGDPSGASHAVYPTKNAFLLGAGFVVVTCALATLVSLLLPRKSKSAPSVAGGGTLGENPLI